MLFTEKVCNITAVKEDSSSSHCVHFLKALADENRWRIVREILTQSWTVGELVERLGISQYNVSKHLRVLKLAGIVETHRTGKFVHAQVTEKFRSQLSSDHRTLDLGCCTFHFD